MIWVVAVVAGLVVAAVEYGAVRRWGWLPAGLRAGSVTALVALVLDAPAGHSIAPRPFAALDVSASWRRGGDSAAYRRAMAIVASVHADSTFLIGDSLRPDRAPATPTDTRSLVRPAVDRALAAGRPLVLVTDGEIDDPDALATLPSRSAVEVIPHAVVRDAAVTALDAPRAAVAGDTISVRATISAGSGGAAPGTVTFALSEPPSHPQHASQPPEVIATTPVPELAPFAEASVTARARIAGADGPHTLLAVVRTRDDAEPRNDTVGVAIDLSPAAGAVFVSTSPDEDARYALGVLRGAVALPTRGFYRVSPGNWRVDGTLTPVAEADVRRAAATAPLVVLHGDTSVFGPPRTATRRAVALITPPSAAQSTGSPSATLQRPGSTRSSFSQPLNAQSTTTRSPGTQAVGIQGPGDEWYATGAPPSPLATALAAVPWDSLPPIDVGEIHPSAGWVGLEAKRARRFDRRVAITGSEIAGPSGGPTRRVVVAAVGGLWQWRFRGGVAGDAYAALWGSIFDWLAAEHSDVRAAIPADPLVREGDVIRWRRGAGAAAGDSVVKLLLVHRTAPARTDSVTLRFPPGVAVAESRPMPAGLYDVEMHGGHAALVVNASREWLPRRPTVQPGRAGGAMLAESAPRVRSLGVIYLLLVAALCAEWLARKRLGLR